MKRRTKRQTVADNPPAQIKLSVADPGLKPVKEIAKAVLPKGRQSISPAAIWRWVHKGRNGVTLPVVQVGRSYLTTREAFIAWWDSQPFLRGETAGKPQRSEGRRAKLKKAGLL